MTQKQIPPGTKQKEEEAAQKKLADKEPFMTYQYIQREGDSTGVESLANRIQRVDKMFFMIR